MNELSQSTPASGWLARMSSRLRAIAQHAAARREFEQLDTAALRDLGVATSEHDSYWAESTGAAEPTRRRVRPVEWG